MIDWWLVALHGDMYITGETRGEPVNVLSSVPRRRSILRIVHYIRDFHSRILQCERVWPLVEASRACGLGDSTVSW